MNPAVLKSIIRTVVPLVVGWILTLTGRIALDVDPSAVTSIVQTVVTAVFYSVVRLAEQHRAWFGWLLGLANPPLYSTDRKANTVILEYEAGRPVPTRADIERIVADLFLRSAGGHPTFRSAEFGPGWDATNTGPGDV